MSFTDTVIQVMAPAFFECLVLVGIHSYLGLHVLRRKVIFVDLALAQIAALGTTVGFLFGIMPGTTGAYWFSLAFTIIGAAVFSISRFRNEKIPQEAIIGLTYAIAAALAILVIDKAPQGAEHIKEILTGSILWVKWETIGKAALVYAVVGGFHFVYRKQFLLISENPDQAYEQGMNVRLWDFLFYLSFGIVITHSVGTAGVLLVFVFLVVPAVASILLTDVLWKQLLIGWGLGVVVSMVGLGFSYHADLPSGPTVVASYGFVLVLIALFRYLKNAGNRSVAALKITAGLGVTIAVVAVFFAMGNLFKPAGHDHAMDAIEQHESEIHQKLDEMDEEKLQAFLKSIHDIEKLRGMIDDETSEFIHLEIAQRLYEIEPSSGLKCYFQILQTSELPFFKEEVLSKIRSAAGTDFGYDISKDAEGNAAAVEKMKAWISKMQ